MKQIRILLVIGWMIFINQTLSAQYCNFTYIQQTEPETSAATFGVALGYFNNDSYLDCAAISAYYAVDIYFNNGSGIFTLDGQYAAGGSFYGVHTDDVDGDGDVDVVAIPFYASSDLVVLINDGSGGFTETSVSTNIGAYNAAMGNIDNDMDQDILIPNGGGGSGLILKNDGYGNFSQFQVVAGARGHDADLSDLDGDGDLDAFVTENSAYANTVFLNDGSGSFSMLGNNFGTQGGAVAIGDLDGDGDQDAWVGGSSNTSEIWLNDGEAGFTMVSTIENGSYCKAVNLEDVDNDDDPDVFLGFYSSNPQVWLNEGSLVFSLCYQAPVGSSCHGQVVGDIDNDNHPDFYSGYFSNDEGDYVFINDAVSGTFDHSFHTKISISPNPSSDIIMISISDALRGERYNVFNSAGTLVMTGTFYEKTFRLDISTLSAGIYLIKTGSPNPRFDRFVKY
jgi:hypothetical protein